MDEFIVAKINADMGKAAPQSIVEDQIAGAQVVRIDLLADMADFCRSARQILAQCFLEYIAHQAAAIQTVFRAVAAILVMDAQHADGLHRQLRGMAGKGGQPG